MAYNKMPLKSSPFSPLFAYSNSHFHRHNSRRRSFSLSSFKLSSSSSSFSAFFVIFCVLLAFLSPFLSSTQVHASAISIPVQQQQNHNHQNHVYPVDNSVQNQVQQPNQQQEQQLPQSPPPQHHQQQPIPSPINEGNNGEEEEEDVEIEEKSTHPPWHLDCTNITYGIEFYGRENKNIRFKPNKRNPYFNPTKPTVLHVTGWEYGRCATKRKTIFNFKSNLFPSPEKLDKFPVVQNLSDIWVDKGWNIGIFQWNSFNEESSMKVAQSKIYNGPLRWRNHLGQYFDNGSDVSVAELFYREYLQVFNDYPQELEIRLTGNSLGCQIVLMGAKLILDRHGPNSNLLPKRIALLDPWFTRGEVAKLNAEAAQALVDAGVVLEYHQASKLCELIPSRFFVGDCVNHIRYQLAAFTRHVPSWVHSQTYSPMGRITLKHVAAFNEYFRSMSISPPEIVCPNNAGRASFLPSCLTGGCLPSSSLSSASSVASSVASAPSTYSQTVRYRDSILNRQRAPSTISRSADSMFEGDVNFAAQLIDYTVEDSRDPSSTSMSVINEHKDENDAETEYETDSFQREIDLLCQLSDESNSIPRYGLSASTPTEYVRSLMGPKPYLMQVEGEYTHRLEDDKYALKPVHPSLLRNGGNHKGGHGKDHHSSGWRSWWGLRHLGKAWGWVRDKTSGWS